jgi:hypothetical protein
MRKLAMIGIAFLLVVSIAYAGVLEYYGKIVGSVNVQPPVFYAHSEIENIAEKNYGKYEVNLPANGPAIEIKKFIDSEGSGRVDTTRFGFLFPTVSSWYPSTWIFYYRTRADVEGAKVQLFVKLYKLSSTGDRTQITEDCGFTSIFSTPINWTTLSGNCSVPSITLQPGERILVEYWANYTNPTKEGYIYIGIDNPEFSIDNQTRIEVSKP